MAHFAKLNENDIVEMVVVVDNENLLNEFGVEDENKGIEYLKLIYGSDTNWVQTSYNRNFRRLFAATNYIYDRVNDIFISYQPYPSWIFNDITKDWDPPTPFPNDGNGYFWDEINLQWILI